MLKNLVDKAKFIGDAERLKLEAAKKVEEHWPKIEAIILEKGLPLCEEKLRDDNSLEQFFGYVHKALPSLVRLVVSKEKFVQYCMVKKEPLLQKIQERRAQAGGTQQLEGNPSLDSHVQFLP